MKLTVTGSTVYRINAAREDDQGCAVDVVVAHNHVGLDPDKLADAFRRALADAVKDAAGSWIDKWEPRETALYAPDMD